MTDRDGFVEFARDVTDSLRSTAYLVCGDWHRADDAVQDCLRKLYVAWPRVQRADNLFAYARRAAVNAAIRQSERPWRRESVVAALPDRPVDDTTGSYADRDELVRVLDLLPAGQRACIVLRYYEDLSVEETAEVLGCSAGTVKSQTSRGLARLRPLLGADTVGATHTKE